MTVCPMVQLETLYVLALFHNGKPDILTSLVQRKLFKPSQVPLEISQQKCFQP